MTELPKKPMRGLGRGLDALLPVRAPATPERPAGAYGENNVFSCPLERIVPRRDQPRQHFDDTSLEELAQSIREHGVIEPLVDLVRHDLGDHAAKVASETLLLPPDLRRVGSTLASDKRASAYVRKHQIRRLIGEAISVRWPRGGIVIGMLFSHVCLESRCVELQRTTSALQSLVP